MSHTAPYPNDSLRWIAAEIRYPPLDEATAGSLPDLREHLRDRFPIREEQRAEGGQNLGLENITISRDCAAHAATISGARTIKGGNEYE